LTAVQNSDHDTWVAQTLGVHPGAYAVAKAVPKPAVQEEVRAPKPPPPPPPDPGAASRALDPNDPARKDAVRKAEEQGRQRDKGLTDPRPDKGKKEEGDKDPSPADKARAPGPHVGEENPLGEGGRDIPLGPVTLHPSTDGTSVGGVQVNIPFGGPKKDKKKSH
jgi:hypothetical protein